MEKLAERLNKAGWNRDHMEKATTERFRGEIECAVILNDMPWVDERIDMDMKIARAMVQPMTCPDSNGDDKQSQDS